jgi:hypothetical protein
MAFDPNRIYGRLGLLWCNDYILYALLMQEILVILAVSAACIFLALQFYTKFVRKDAKCKGCAVGKIQEK